MSKKATALLEGEYSFVASSWRAIQSEINRTIREGIVNRPTIGHEAMMSDREVDDILCGRKSPTLHEAIVLEQAWWRCLRRATADRQPDGLGGKREGDE